jgi:hypothetical protein
MPGGSHPPLTHTQSAAGWADVHAAPVEGAGCAGCGADHPAGGVMPGGSHPPLKQVQSGAGCAVVHATVDEGGACGAGWDDDPEAGIPGGSHPPLTQIQSGPGCTVVHCAASADPASAFACARCSELIALIPVTSAIT